MRSLSSSIATVMDIARIRNIAYSAGLIGPPRIPSPLYLYAYVHNNRPKRAKSIPINNTDDTGTSASHELLDRQL